MPQGDWQLVGVGPSQGLQDWKGSSPVWGPRLPAMTCSLSTVRTQGAGWGGGRDSCLMSQRVPILCVNVTGTGRVTDWVPWEPCTPVPSMLPPAQPIPSLPQGQATPVLGSHRVRPKSLIVPFPSSLIPVPGREPGHGGALGPLA